MEPYEKGTNVLEKENKWFAGNDILKENCQGKEFQPPDLIYKN